MSEEHFEFVYPANARQIKRPESPLVAWYGGSAPPGCYVSRAGVVTSKNEPTPDPDPNH